MRHLGHRQQSLDDFFSDRKQEQEDRHPGEEEPHSYDHFPTYQPLAPEEPEEEPKLSLSAPTNNLQRYFQAISRHPQLTYEGLVHWAKQMDEGRSEFRRGLLVQAHYITYPQIYSLEDQLRREVVSYQDVLDDPRGREEEVMGNFYRHLAQLKQAIDKVPFPIDKKQRRYAQKNKALLLNAAGLGEKLPVQPDWWQKTAAKVYASSAVAEELKKQLRTAYQQFEHSKQKIVEGNLPLVVSIARRFLGRRADILDAIQDGNIGLMKAAERFDYKRGYRFSTYATWWIRHNIQRGINDNGRTIRHPVYAWDAYYKLRRGEKELEEKLGRPASEEEVAARMEFSVGKIRQLKQLEHRAMLSLNSQVSGEDLRTFQDFLVDENTPAPGEELAQEELARKVHESMELLSPREYRVLQERFGLVSRSERTLKEVGGVFGLTRERARQIQEKALGKLRQKGKLKAALG